jgi:NitT/TauT family transport system substrate-binding protein
MAVRRELLRGAAAALLASSSAYWLAPPVRSQSTVLRVKYDWLMSNGQVGDIAALKKGFFEEQGFKAEFIAGGPNSATVPPVTTGQALIGQFSSTNQAMIAASSGIPIKVFAAGYRAAPFGYFSLPKAPVRKPEDLIGKRVGTQPTARFATDALLKKHNIDPSKLKIINIGFDMTPLMSGDVDVVTGWVTNTKALSVIGPDRIDFLMRDAGIANYGNAYFASSDNLAKQGEQIAKFLTAVSKGWEWAFRNRSQAVDMMCDAYPNLEREIEHKSIDTVMGLSFDKDTAANGWGTFDPARIQETLDLFSSIDFFKEKKSPKLADFVTLQILDATKATRPRLGG